MNEQVNLILGVIQSVKFGQKLLEERRGLFNEHTDDHRRIVFRLCKNINSTENLEDNNLKATNLLLLQVNHVLPTVQAAVIRVPALWNVIAQSVKEEFSGSIGVND